jgi:hypothetical protein
LAAGILFVGAAESAALAQLGTASLTWEVLDETSGAWVRDSLTTTDTTLDIRLHAQWSPELGIAFGYTFFDGIVRTASPLDAAIAGRPPRGWDELSGSSISTTRFGDLIKIDDARDMLPPGEGPRYVIAGQNALAFADLHQNRNNPVYIYTFSLDLDGPGTRSIESIHREWLPPSGGNPACLARIYTHESGSTSQPPTFLQGLDIHVVPAPASLALLVAGLMPFRRRGQKQTRT